MTVEILLADGNDPQQLARQVGDFACHDALTTIRMASLEAFLVSGATLRFDTLDFVYAGSMESVVGAIFARPEPLVTPPDTTGPSAFVLNMSSDHLMAMLGPNPTQERFHLVSYSVSTLAFQASGEEPLT